VPSLLTRKTSPHSASKLPVPSKLFEYTLIAVRKYGEAGTWMGIRYIALQSVLRGRLRPGKVSEVAA